MLKISIGNNRNLPNAKDKFESERLVMKILLNKGNDLNKKK